MITFSTQIELDSGKRASFSINRENGLAVFLAALFFAVILFVVFAPVIAASPDQTVLVDQGMSDWKRARSVWPCQMDQQGDCF